MADDTTATTRELYTADTVPIFERYARFERIGTLLELPRNHVIFRAKNVPECCYIVKAGQVITYEFTQAGTRHVFSNTGSNEPDSLLLLSGTLLGYRVPVSFMTVTPATLVCIRRDAILHAIGTDPRIAADVAFILARKFVEVNERYRAESGGSAPRRLCSLLLMLADKYGVDYDGKLLIRQKYSQQMMADYLHVNRTTVARAIKDLTDAGLVERINDYYCIRSIDKLQHYMDIIDPDHSDW